MKLPKPTLPHQQRRKKRERLLGILALLSFIVAWIIGYQLENADVEPYLHEAMPEANRFEKLDAISYAVYTDADAQSPSGYIGIGESNGYGGPLKMAVAVDLEGTITGMAVIQHRETPSWFRKVSDSDFLKSFLSKSYEDPFQLGEDVDGITSATYTSRAIAKSALEGSRSIAANQLGFDVPPTPKPKIIFGAPEIALLAIFGVGYFGHQRNFKYKKQLRWAGLFNGHGRAGFHVQQTAHPFDGQSGLAGLLAPVAKQHLLVPDDWRNNLRLHRR